MTIAWNDCQSTVFMMFHEMLGTNIGRAIGIFFAVKSDTGQRDITLGLANNALALRPELLAKMKTSFAAFNKIAGRRNDFIHAIWHNPPGTEDLRVWLDVRQRLLDKNPVAECKELLEVIRSLFLDLVLIRTEVTEAMKPPASLLSGLPSGSPQQ